MKERGRKIEGGEGDSLRERGRKIEREVISGREGGTFIKPFIILILQYKIFIPCILLSTH